MAQANSVAQSAAVPKMFILMLAAWLFDFQSAGEGEGVDIQAYFIATYLFALVMLLISDRNSGQRIRGLGMFMTFGGLFLIVGISSGISNGQTAYPILRNAASVFIYLSAAYATARMVVMTNPTSLRFVLSIFCLLYAISGYFIYDFMSGGVDLQNVRFQIIGASAMAALGYAVLAVLFRLSRVEQAAMIINGVILVLSITRSFILVALAQGSPFIGRIRRVFSPRLILVGAAALIGLFAFLYFGQSQLLRWEDRISGSGSNYSEYQTLYTRLSEWTFMFGEWTQSLRHFFLGSGMAAQSIYEVPLELGGGTEFMIGFGHSLHLSLPFIAGAVGGLPLLLVQWYQAFLGWRFLRRTIAYPHLRNDAVFLGAWGGTILLGFFAINFVSAPFVTRNVSLWFGIGTGLLLGAQARFDPDNAPRRNPRAAVARSRLKPA